MASTKYGRFTGDNGPAKAAFNPGFSTSSAGNLSVKSPGSPRIGFNPPKSGVQRTQPSGDGDTDSAAINRQIAVWDGEMDSLDKQQEQLLNDQWKLLRTQIGSLMGALAEVKAEMADLKNNVLSKEMEAVIENMVQAHDGHDAKHSSALDRLDYIEKVLGESVDKHNDHAQHKTGMEERMEYIEATIGDNADKHKQMLEDLANQVAGCAKAEHHAGMEERVNYLETFLGESADKHAADLDAHAQGWVDHKATMETRLEYLEALAGDSADRHSKEIAALKKGNADLHEAISKCAKTEHHASMEERMAYIEQVLGESADKHDDHKTTIETRMEFLEGMLGDSAEKHFKEIEAAKGKLNDLHKAISTCAKSEHHSSLEKRMEYLEKFLGESADKHDDHKATMDTRLMYLEGMLGDSADKHTKELDAAKAKLGNLDKAIMQCAKAEHHGTLETRVNAIERAMNLSGSESAELKNSHNHHKKTVEQRLDSMENMLSTDSKSKDANSKIEFAEARIRDVAAKLSQQQAANDGIKSSLEQRLNYIESTVSEGGGGGGNRIEQRLQILQDDQLRNQDSFKHMVNMTIKEQQDLQNSAIMSQTSQMKELWDREAMSRHSSAENYKHLLAQERNARDVSYQQLEGRINSIEMTLSLEPPQVRTYIAQQPMVVQNGIQEIDKVDAFGRVVERDFVSRNAFGQSMTTAVPVGNGFPTMMSNASVGYASPRTSMGPPMIMGTQAQPMLSSVQPMNRQNTIM